MAITNVDDFAAYCLLCQVQQSETGRVEGGRLGEFLKGLFKNAPELRARCGKLTILVQGHPDLFLSGTTVTLRRGWLDRSLPRFDDEATLDDPFESEDQDRNLEEQPTSDEAPVAVTMLREAASRYLTRRLKLKSYKKRLRTEACKSDEMNLVQRFRESVRSHGILRLEVVLAEIDHACGLRNISEDTWRFPFFL